MLFTINTNFFPRTSYMQRNIYPDTWSHFPRTPKEYMLFLIRDGILYLKEDDVSYELHPGDVILLEPGLTHVGYRAAFVDFYFIHMPAETFSKLALSSQEAVSRYLADCQMKFYKTMPFDYELYEQYQLPFPKQFQLDRRTQQFVFEKMDESILSLTTGDISYKLTCSSNLLGILTRISKEYAHSIQSDSAKRHPDTNIDQRVHSIFTYIQDHYAQRITGALIEEALHTNFDYLNRVFKANTGSTIFQYLSIFRINKAKEFLITTNKKAYEIAVETGFANEYHFHRVFSNKVGMTPTQFRKSQRL